MRTKLIALAGVLLLVAACETTPEEGAGAAGEGGAAAPAPSGVTTTPGDGAAPSIMTLQDRLVQEVGDRVFFDFDSSVVRSDGEETLRRQAAFLQENAQATITVNGHCDERGTREYNLALGERRAVAAKNYLVSLGISADRIATVSFGKERPIVLGHDEAAWAQNRVAVTVLN